MGLVDVRIIVIITMVHRRKVQIHYIQTEKPTRSCRGVPPHQSPSVSGSFHRVEDVQPHSLTSHDQGRPSIGFTLLTTRFWLCPSITHATSVKVTDSIALFLLVEMRMERFERTGSLILASKRNSNSNQLKFIISM